MIFCPTNRANSSFKIVNKFEDESDLLNQIPSPKSPVTPQAIEPLEREAMNAAGN